MRSYNHQQQSSAVRISSGPSAADLPYTGDALDEYTGPRAKQRRDGCEQERVARSNVQVATILR